MSKEEKSKYHLVLLDLPSTIIVDKCSDEVARLQKEYLAIDRIFSLREDLPLIKELINERFMALNNRMCELNSGKK